jgi:acetate kinase
MKVIALNSGSSSVKLGIYEVDADGEKETTQIFSQSLALSQSQSQAGATSETILDLIRLQITNAKLGQPAAIGHRIVHGGPNLSHCVIDDQVMKQLEEAALLAPLHSPNSLGLIRESKTYFPDTPQIACFDTAFHATLPRVAHTFPIAHAFQKKKVRRYGFHGLSCESIVRQLRIDSLGNFPSRLIVAHLGNGVSVTAVKDGQSIDTTMGLTPSGGVIMGTRSGDLDPGLMLYLMRQENLDLSQMEHSINFESGLLGISGISSDMRRLHEIAASSTHSSSDAAGLAIEMFCYSLRKQIAGMIAALGGLNTLVFTGGIGENDESVRSTICNDMAWIKQDNERPKVMVMQSQEELQIAQVVANVLRLRP